MKTTLWITLLIIIVIASFKLGVNTGIYQFDIYDSPYKAYIAVAQLEKLDNQNLSFIKTTQEFRLTDEIVKYGEYLDYGMPWLLWPYNTNPSPELFGDTPSQEEFMKKAIEYRRTHPVEPHFAPSSTCLDAEVKSEACIRVIELTNDYYKVLQGRIDP